jgi:DnaJ-class molecular chaperone
MVPTMTGSVALTVPGGTPNGKVFRLAGKGMPRQGASDFGTLYATISVVLPDAITEEEQTLFEQLKTLTTPQAPQTVDEPVTDQTD